MLKPGDHVLIDGRPIVGVVKHVHPHEAIVEVSDDESTTEQRFALESLRREGTMDEVSGFER